MDLWMDDPVTDRQFNALLQRIRQCGSGEVVAQMKRLGLNYAHNWGVPVTLLREMMQEYEPSHLLALKLWNRRWRETMILATLADEPGQVTEEQMDFWTRGFETTEIAELASAHLWSKTPFAYAKALEWCRGKKHLTRYTGIHLLGRMALTDRKSPDEMFTLFFDQLATLSKDRSLETVLGRTLTALSLRSPSLCRAVAVFAGGLDNPALAVCAGQEEEPPGVDGDGR